MNGVSFIRVSFCDVGWPVFLAVWWNSLKCLNYLLTIGVLPTSRAQSFSQGVVVAEWLRRWTRNPLGSPRVGSNPTDYEQCLVDEHLFYKEIAG